MDEIIIDDKKYISSKRAAKETGYAKDYVGQLCREGRVQARLVGRSWYVLESSIQDHRFGETEQRASAIGRETVTERALAPTWDAPRYEAPMHAPLPPLMKAEAEGESMPDGESGAAHEEAISAEEVGVYVDSERSEPHNDENIVVTSVYETKPVSASGEAAQEDIPEVSPEAGSEPKRAHKRKRGLGMAIVAALQLVMVLIALSAVAVATINSGVIDRYLISDTRVELISGTRAYTKH